MGLTTQTALAVLQPSRFAGFGDPDRGSVAGSQGLKCSHDLLRQTTHIKLDAFPRHVIEVTGTSAADYQRLTKALTTSSETPAAQFDAIAVFLAGTDRKAAKVSIALTAVYNVPVSEFLDQSNGRWGAFDQWSASLDNAAGPAQSAATKADIFDPKRVAEILKSLGNDVVVCSLDYRGVGDGNSYGFRDNVDQFFSNVRKRCNIELAGKAVLVEWGGDERVLLVRKDSSEEIFSKFLEINREVRNAVFRETDQNFQDLHGALQLREKFRALSKDFLMGELDLRNQVAELAASTLLEAFPQLKAANLDPSAVKILALARRAVTAGDAKLPSDFFLGVSCGRVDFDARVVGATPEVVLKGVAQGFRGQLSTKVGGVLSPPEPFTPDLQLRDADSSSLQAGAALARTRDQLRNLGRLVQTSHVGFLIAGQIALAVNRSDAALTRVDGAPLFILNANKSKDLSLARLDISPPVSVVKFDMSAFRQFNNTIGYSEADARFLKFAQAIEAECAGILLVRSGGSIMLVASGELPEGAVKRVEKALSECYAKVVGGVDSEKVRLQFELDRARALYDALVRGAPQQVVDSLSARKYGSPEVTVFAPFTGNEDTPLYDVISR